MAHRDPSADCFEAERGRLWALAYRMLGTRADAEDAVQDTYLRWHEASHATIEVPAAWLTTVCTRICVDRLRAAKRARLDYVGPWLPEPVADRAVPDPGDEAELAESLSIAFLVLLERLNPVERAAYLLREVFDYDYQALAAVLGKSSANCRQIVSRARRRLGPPPQTAAPGEAEFADLCTRFFAALEAGDVDAIEAMLSEDISLWSDGGGKALAALNVIQGASAVARFLIGIAGKRPAGLVVEPSRLNGAPALILREDAAAIGTFSFELDREGRIRGLYAVRNPDKLAGLD
jgi:RNA polymerase sigma-70 factor (ECF subfamily)